MAKLKDFDNFIDTLTLSNISYDNLVDWDKVFDRFDEYKYGASLFDTLIGSKTIEDDFLKLLSKYPDEVMLVLPVLVAIATNKRKELNLTYQNKPVNVKFDNSEKPKKYLEFLTETKVLEMLQTKMIKSIPEYLKGIEVGLDSNARKNRNGNKAQETVRRYLTNLKEAGADFEYYEQAMIIDKKVDFLIELKKVKIAIETSFYNGGGSKISEVIRSYASLSKKLLNQGVHFVWIADGDGIKKTKKALLTNFDEIEYVLNFQDLHLGKLEKIIASYKK